MIEIIFIVEEAAEGGYTGRALGESIFTEGDDVDEIRRNVREAVEGHLLRASTKLGVRRRGELAAALGESPEPA